MTWEKAHESLLSAIIGSISTIDLLNIKKTLDDYPNDIIKEYYQRAIDDHCKMSMYNNCFLQ